MSSGLAIASTKDWAIIKFSARDGHRYRFREKDSSANVSEIESRFSRYGRLRAPALQIRAILGIVWDIESKDWKEALIDLDPNKAFLLVRWTDHRDTWEQASNVLALAEFAGRKDFLHQLARKQEEAYERAGDSRPDHTVFSDQGCHQTLKQRLKSMKAKIVPSRRKSLAKRRRYM